METCGNAIRFARRMVRVGFDATEATVAVIVEDDGPGFAEDGAAGRGGRHRAGLGLSLSIARQVLAAHGGRLRVEGGAARPGAVVVLELPRKTKGGAPATQSSAR
jgi:two-component system sensor histidine kinase RegB